MAQIHTHYVNLEVARDAPPHVIRAAYQRLAEKFHPARNPGDRDAAQMMEIIAASYAVLSDPVKRKEHDRWVAQHERTRAPVTTPNPRPQPRPVQQRYAAPQQPVRRAAPDALTAHLRRHWWRYGGLAMVLLLAAIGKVGESLRGPDTHRTDSATVVPGYVRPDTAPNGQPWPAAAGYIRGYERLHNDGLASVTIDNSRNDADVFVKLVSLDSGQATPVRWCYIPASGSFALNTVRAGRYDIRYRDLTNGRLSRSEEFKLEERQTPDGTQFSNLTMTLYKVQNGNMRTYGLAETEF